MRGRSRPSACPQRPTPRRPQNRRPSSCGWRATIEARRSGSIETPLLKEKNTLSTVRRLIHRYAIGEAVAGGAVLPLICEERLVEQQVSDAVVDRWSDKLEEIGHGSGASIISPPDENEGNEEVDHVPNDLMRDFWSNDDGAVQDRGGTVVTVLFSMLMLGQIERFRWRGVMQPLLQRHMAPIWAGPTIGATWDI